LSKVIQFFNRATRPIRAVGRAAIFVLKLFPMIPSKPVDWVTKAPAIEKVRYPTHDGQAGGEVYRPATDGPHPGIIVCLGVVPFGVDHPQVPILGRALARAGFAALFSFLGKAASEHGLFPVAVVRQPGFPESRI
jgi:hypothetical protein